MQSIQIKTSFGDSYSLTAEESAITISAYLTGSLTGGSGTEKHSEVNGNNLSQLLGKYDVNSSADLLKLAASFDQAGKDSFIEIVTKLEKILHIWSETDWSDRK